MEVDIEASIRFARELEAAGCAMLCVHGRTRAMIHGKVRNTDLEAIRKIKVAPLPPRAHACKTEVCERRTAVDSHVHTRMHTRHRINRRLWASQS